MRNKAPRHSFLAVVGLDLEGQPALKGLFQQHRRLLPVPVVRQEGTETAPFVRLPWAGVANLRTERKDIKHRLLNTSWSAGPQGCCLGVR